jgi:putative multiple sugar transport system permease protein
MVEMHVPWPLAVLITIAVGAAIGAVQGHWVAYFGIPAFIVTLAGMLVFRALTLTVLGNQGIGPFPDAVRTLSNGFLAGFLGNIGLGPLGGADLFTLLVGLARRGGDRVHPVARA